MMASVRIAAQYGSGIPHQARYRQRECRADAVRSPCHTEGRFSLFQLRSFTLVHLAAPVGCGKLRCFFLNIAPAERSTHLRPLREVALPQFG